MIDVASKKKTQFILATLAVGLTIGTAAFPTTGHASQGAVFSVIANDCSVKNPSKEQKQSCLEAQKRKKAREEREKNKSKTQKQ